MSLATCLDSASPDVLLAAAQRTPFTGNVTPLSAPEGSSIAEFVALGFPAHEQRFVVAELDGDEIAPERWAQTRPVAGQALTLVFRPGGKFARTILQIAVIAVAAWVSGGALAGVFGQAFAAGGIGAAIAAAGVSIVGNLLINSLIPLQGPSGATRDAPPPFYSITGAQNASPAWGKVPLLFGRHRIVPPTSGQVIREAVGDETYIRIPLLLGVTPMAVSEWRAGETLLADLPGVEIETRLLETDPPHTLYVGDPQQSDVNVQLGTDYTVRTTAANCDEIELLIAFRNGLGAYNSKQQKIAASVSLNVEYRRAGSADAWTSLRPDVPQANAASAAVGVPFRPGLLVAGMVDAMTYYTAALDAVPAVGRGAADYTRSDPGRAFVASIRFAVPRGQWDVHVARTAPQSTDPNTTDAVWWEAINSISVGTDPFPNRKLATAVIRMKSGPETTGVIERINCIGESLQAGFSPGALALPATATAGSLTAIEASRNPGRLGLLCLRGAHNAIPKPDAEIHWPAWADFTARCTAAGLTFDEYVQGTISRWDMLKRICAAGHARPVKLLDGRVSVIIDRDRTGEPPVQVFSTRNVRNFRWRKTFPRDVHAIRVGFANELNGWNADEVIIYKPGHSAETATIFEQVPIPGKTHPDGVRTVGNQYIRNAHYQTEGFDFDIDIEGLTATDGAYVLLRHDVILVGLGDAKVKSLQTSGGNVIGFTLDVGIATEAGPTLGARWRKVRASGGVGRIEVDGEVVVTRDAGDSRIFTFSSPRSAANAPAVGDLVSIGETGQVAFPALVQAIRPLPGLAASVSLVSYAGERFATGVVWPPHNPMTSIPLGGRPATPELVAASAQSREIAVAFKQPMSPRGVTITGFDVAVRQHAGGAGLWAPAGVLQAEERLATVPAGDPGTAYDVRIIALGRDNGGISVMSNWLIVPNITANGSPFEPQSVNASFVVRTSTAGSSQPVLVATWTPNEDPDVTDTYVEMLASTGPDVWRALGSAPAIAGALEIHGLQVDRTYTLRFFNVTRRGAISARVLKTGVVAPDSLIAAYSGVASSIVGQAPAATDPTIQSGATKNLLSFSGSAPVSPTNGDIWVDTSSTPYIIKTRVGGVWNLSGSYGGVFGSTLYEAGGGAVASLSNFKTILGIASAITGQAPAATDSTIATGATKNIVTFNASAPASPVNGDIWVDTSTTPYIIKTRIAGAWQNSGSYGGIFGSTLYEAGGGAVATLANFKTSSGTAAAIAGQGDLATTNRATLGFGVNGLVDSDFLRGTTFWNGYWPGNTGLGVTVVYNLGGYSGIRNVICAYVSGTPANGTVFECGESSGSNIGSSETFKRALRVSPGDRVYARALLGAHRCYASINVKYFNGSGVFVTEATGSMVTAQGGGGSGDPANFSLSEGYFTVPAGCYLVGLSFRGHCNGVGGGATPYVFATEPMLMRVPAGQTALAIPYAPGATDPLGDQTSGNTAGGIAGQGSQATANHYRGPTYPYTPTEGSWWADTSANWLKLYTGGAWNNVAPMTASTPPSPVGYSGQWLSLLSNGTWQQCIAQNITVVAGQKIRVTANCNAGVAETSTVTEVKWRVEANNIASGTPAFFSPSNAQFDNTTPILISGSGAGIFTANASGTMTIYLYAALARSTSTGNGKCYDPGGTIYVELL